VPLQKIWASFWCKNQIHCPKTEKKKEKKSGSDQIELVKKNCHVGAEERIEKKKSGSDRIELVKKICHKAEERIEGVEKIFLKNESN